MVEARTARVRVANFLRQMNWMRGLRAGVALCAPLVLGDLTHLPGLGWAALGGFEAILADQGGPYRSRLESLTMLSLGGAAGLFVGSLAGSSPSWAVVVTVLWCLLWSYSAVLGHPFSTAGVLVQVIFVCGIGSPAAGWREALPPALMLLAGGAWAALFSLIVWPLDAARPARSAVAGCYAELASFTASIAELAGKSRQPASFWHRLATQHQYRVRRAVEQAWAAVAALPSSGRQSSLGHHLIVLLEHADLLIARTVAVAEHLEAQAVREESSCLPRSLSGLDDIRQVEEWIAGLLQRRREQTPAHARARRSQMQRLPAYLASCPDPADPSAGLLEPQIAAASSLLDGSVESVALLRFGTGSADSQEDLAPSPHHFSERLAGLRSRWHPERIGGELRANLNPRSLIARHAARVALVCGLDLAVIQSFHIDHGYWLLMTSLIVLQPHVSGTLRRSLERIGGTIGGGILAALLAVALKSQLATAAVLFPLAVLALAILPLSYAAFAFFLTPAFVLAWLPYSGDWRLALVRTVNTALGAGIAVLAMLFLFPSYERERAPEFLRASLRADREYLLELMAQWVGRSANPGRLAQARRGAGLAHNDTEESLDRLLTERLSRRLPFAEFATAFVTYLRRFAQSVTTLAALEGEQEWKRSAEVSERLELLGRRLAWLEAEVESEGSGGAYPAGAAAPAAGSSRAADRVLGRMERQVEILARHLATLRENGWLPGVGTV